MKELAVMKENLLVACHRLLNMKQNVSESITHLKPSSRLRPTFVSTDVLSQCIAEGAIQSNFLTGEDQSITSFT